MMTTSQIKTSEPLSRKTSVVVPRSVDYVGFANFPNQVFRRCIKNGFEFTLMVVGQSGLGKSTFLNSLFLTEINSDKQPKTTAIPSTVSVESKTVRMVENDVRLDITFVDSPGFGDQVNNSNCWDPVIKYIDSQFHEYLNEETKIERSANIPDHRVHLCLYFIAPTGHGLKPLDIEFMRALHDRVNLVPVIAKADTLTTKEMALFKMTILQDLKKHDIHLYEFPELDPEETVVETAGMKSEKNGTQDYRKRIPFAVVGSNHVKQDPKDDTRKIRFREYPWGVVEVENMKHNDFLALRHMLIRKNLIDLIDVTKNVHYENFRFRQMSKMPKSVLDSDPFTQMEQDRKEMEREATETRSAKERIFKEKVQMHEKKIQDRVAKLDEEEAEHERKLKEKRAELEKLSQV